jgi:hypothetical protein
LRVLNPARPVFDPARKQLPAGGLPARIATADGA